MKYSIHSQRRHVRLAAPILVKISGELYEVEDWSIGGFALSDPLPNLQQGDHIECLLIFQVESGYFSLELDSCCVRNDDKIAFKFNDIPDNKAEIISYFAQSLLTGEVAEIDGVMRRLERPFSSQLEPEMPKERSWKQAISKTVTTFIVITLAAAGLFLSGTAIYNNVIRIEISEAMLIRKNVINPENYPESMGNRSFIRAYPTRRELSRIDSTSSFDIYIPAMDKNISGRIIEIIDFSVNDPRMEVIVNQANQASEQGYPLAPLSWERVIVEIEIDESDDFGNSVSITGILPAVVYFSRKFN